MDALSSEYRGALAVIRRRRPSLASVAVWGQTRPALQELAVQHVELKRVVKVDKYLRNRDLCKELAFDIHCVKRPKSEFIGSPR
jgi:hypothetical protein